MDLDLSSALATIQGPDCSRPDLISVSWQGTAGTPLVLVVDDQEDNLQLAIQALALFGYSHISASDARTALELSQRYSPTLILLDLALPDLSGLEVARRLKQNPQTAAIPIVAVTALAMAGDRERALAAGCDDYLSKPYDLDDLETVVHRCLSRSFLVAL